MGRAERFAEVDELFDAYSKLAVGKSANGVLSASCLMIAMGIWKLGSSERTKMFLHMNKLIDAYLAAMDREEAKRENGGGDGDKG
jgi:hypothetical protein